MKAGLLPSVTTIFFLGLPTSGSQPGSSQVPDSLVYRTIEGPPLHLYLFRPSGPQTSARRNAILHFHGGGWTAGAPSWTYEAARSFSAWGLVSIAVQYRLASGDITPLDALEDVCAALGWVRAHAADLGLTERLVGYGVSAGGHLIAATATIGCKNGVSGPGALLLLSPALDLARDRWFASLLKGRATVSSVSPVEHVHSSTPPTSIVQGAADVLTPLAGAERYCARLRQHDQVCDLHVYPGLGHLLTRDLTDQESRFDPDPRARADGMARHRLFLERLGFLPRR
jgi:acetyl esterase/lipase